jgi:hypothetical protein
MYPGLVAEEAKKPMVPGKLDTSATFLNDADRCRCGYLPYIHDFEGHPVRCSYAGP